jgi:hypothetical protein
MVPVAPVIIGITFVVVVVVVFDNLIALLSIYLLRNLQPSQIGSGFY